MDPMTFSLRQAGHVFTHVHTWLVWMIGLSVGLHKKVLNFMQSGQFLGSNTFAIQNIPLNHTKVMTFDLLGYQCVTVLVRGCIT